LRIHTDKSIETSPNCDKLLIIKLKMKYIKKLWSRILISLVLGGLTNELYIVAFSEDPNNDRTNFSLVLAILLFLAFTLIVKLEYIRSYYFSGKNEAKKEELNE